MPRPNKYTDLRLNAKQRKGLDLIFQDVVDDPSTIIPVASGAWKATLGKPAYGNLNADAIKEIENFSCKVKDVAYDVLCNPPPQPIITLTTQEREAVLGWLNMIVNDVEQDMRQTPYLIENWDQVLMHEYGLDRRQVLKIAAYAGAAAAQLRYEVCTGNNQWC